MAVITHGGTLPDSSAKTDFYALIDNATVAGIVNADISNSAAIADSKLAQITTASKVSTAALTGTIPFTSITSYTGGIQIIIDGGGAVVTTGSKGYIIIPFACAITSNTLLADQSGSAVVDIKTAALPSYPITSLSTSSICASAKPTLSSKMGTTDSTLTGWTKAITAGTVMEFNVDSCTTCTRLTLLVAYSRPS